MKNKKQILFLLVFTSILLISMGNQVIGQKISTTETETITYIIPDMDTHVQENNPDVHWYREVCMTTDDNIGIRHEIYIHFNINLHFYRSVYRWYFSFVGWGGEAVYIFEVDNSWNEETITYESKPSQIKLINTITLDGGFDERYETEIDGFMDTSEISFAIIAILDSSYTYIYSSDYGCLKYIPYIRIVEDISSSHSTPESEVKSIISGYAILIGIIVFVGIAVSSVVIYKRRKNDKLIRLDEREKKPIETKETIMEEFKFCSTCGSKIYEFADYCSLCGNKQ